MRKCASILALLLATAAIRAEETKQAAYPALPEAFSSFGAANCDGFAYVYGGHTGKPHTYSTETVNGKFRRVNLAKPAQGWEELPGGPGLQGLALVSHGGKVYRIGGMQPRNKPGDPADNVSVATCSVYDPQTKQWSALPDLPAGRSSHDAVVVGDKVVVVGGWTLAGQGQKGAWHTTTLILDLAKKPLAWESVPQPFERRALNAAVLDGKVYVICGMTSENELEKVVDIFDPATKKWSDGPEVPGPIRNGFTPAACGVAGKLFVSPADGNLYRLNDKRTGWDTVGKLEKARTVHRLVPARDDLLLVLGGSSRAGNVSLSEAIEPACCNGAALPVTPAFVAKPGEQNYCPVMTKTIVEAESREVEYNGVKIKLCCSACIRKWKANPEAYLNVAILPQLKDVVLPKRKLEQVYCPVYVDRIISEQDPSTEYKGTTIYFFNESAKKKFLADPTKYADAGKLPQLKTSSR